MSSHCNLHSETPSPHTVISMASVASLASLVSVVFVDLFGLCGPVFLQEPSLRVKKVGRDGHPLPLKPSQLERDREMGISIQ